MLVATVKARITGHSENGAPLKTGRVVQELVPPHTNDSLKTGRHSQNGAPDQSSFFAHYILFRSP